MNLFLLKNFLNFGLIYINCKTHNIFFTITNLKNKILFFYSCGLLGSKKLGSFVTQNISFFITKKLNVYQIKFVFILLKGFGFNRFSSFKGLFFSNIKILRIFDTTSVAFNGCKSSKKKRL